MIVVNEENFIFHVVCMNGDNNGFERIKDITSTNIDWRLVLGRAIHHRVIPKFHQNLGFLKRTELKDCIPSWFFEKVQELNYTFIGRSLVLQEEINKVFKLLKSKGIKFTPIKGALLAETVYPKKELRFFNDIDLLFPNNHEKKRAEEILVNLGYELFLDFLKASAFRRNRSGVPLEFDLHRTVSLFKYVDYPIMEDLWKNMSEEEVGGIKIKVLSAEDMLVVLCIHSFKDRTFLLQDFCDAIQILSKKPNLDWDYILELCKKYHCVLGIPLGIINLMFAKIFKETFIPKENFKLFRYVKKFMSRLGEINIEKIMKNPEGFIVYENFCHKCIRYKFCLSYFLDSYKDVKNFKMRAIKVKILEYCYILTSIKRSLGIKYALKCFWKQSIRLLGKIFLRIPALQ